MTNYSFLSTHIWDLFFQMHAVSANHDGNTLILFNRLTNRSLSFALAMEETQELHPFDLLVELADRLRWSDETNTLVERVFGAAMINDLLSVVEDIEDAQLA